MKSFFTPGSGDDNWRSPDKRAYRPKAKPADRIIGGDPRAAGLVLKAKTLDPTTAADPKFLGRLEAFLRLKPMDWMGWGSNVATTIAQAAQVSSTLMVKVQTANAPKWADETRTAYQKGPGFFNKRPAFYQQMLENAQRMLMEAAGEADTQRRALIERIPALKIDQLVLQVATDGLTDPMEMQIASGQMRTMLTNLQTAMSIRAALEASSLTIVKQAGDVNQLLTALIPAWVAAQGKA